MNYKTRPWLNLVCLWPFLVLELLCRCFSNIAFVVAPPSQIFLTLCKELWSGALLLAASETIYKVILAIGFAVLIGYPCGFLSGLSNWSRIAFARPADFARSIPTLVLIPVFMLLVPPGDNMVIAMAAYPTFGMILAGVADSVGATADRRGKMCKAIGMKRWDFVRHCLFWETVGTTALVVASALPMTIAIIVALEYFEYSNAGLGHYVTRARTMLRDAHGNHLPVMYAGIFCCGVLGLAAAVTPRLVLRRYLKWAATR